MQDAIGQLVNSTRLLYWILLGILSGVLLGGIAPDVGASVSFLGDVFLQALLMLVIPLVMASIIVGVTGLGDIRQLGGLGLRTLLYFLVTTGLAVLVGIILVTTIEPGSLSMSSGQPQPRLGQPHPFSAEVPGQPQTVWQLFRQVLVGLVPHNLFMAMANADVLPLILFSLIFGAVLTTMGDRGQTVIRFFEGVNEAVMRIVHLLMWGAPIGIGALIAGRLGGAGGFSGFWPELLGLGSYVATVLLALMVQGMLILPLILRFLGRTAPWAFGKQLGTALTTAFSTSSSSATLPMTMEGVTERNVVSLRTASFVLPLGATINMNGTALYEAVAAIFIAQVYGIDLDAGHLLIVFLTATLAAIGAAGIPEAGLVTMVIVLKAVHLPLEGVSLILVIDWFLDRCRTTVNVWGDAVGAAVVEQYEKKKTLRRLDTGPSRGSG